MIHHSLALFALCLGIVPPAAGQSVIYPDPPPHRADSARPQPTATGGGAVPRDTVRASPTPYGINPAPPAPARPPAPQPPAPAQVPLADPVVVRACADAVPGEAAPDLLAIVFARGAPRGADDAALAAVGGKRLGGSAGDRFQYMQVPADGNEFRLRALADKLIRLAGVSEVGPVTCPAAPAAPPPAARPDSASS